MDYPRFLQVFREYPVLWDASHKYHNNKIIYKSCLQEFQHHLNDMNLLKDVSDDNIMRKIKHMLGVYNEERMKMKRSHGLYIPTQKWILLALFLDKSRDSHLNTSYPTGKSRKHEEIPEDESSDLDTSPRGSPIKCPEASSSTMDYSKAKSNLESSSETEGISKQTIRFTLPRKSPPPANVALLSGGIHSATPKTRGNSSTPKIRGNSAMPKVPETTDSAETRRNSVAVETNSDQHKLLHDGHPSAKEGKSGNYQNVSSSGGVKSQEKGVPGNSSLPLAPPLSSNVSNEYNSYQPSSSQVQSDFQMNDSQTLIDQLFPKPEDPDDDIPVTDAEGGPSLPKRSREELAQGAANIVDKNAAPAADRRCYEKFLEYVADELYKFSPRQAILLQQEIQNDITRIKLSSYT